MEFLSNEANTDDWLEAIKDLTILGYVEPFVPDAIFTFKEHGDINQVLVSSMGREIQAEPMEYVDFP